MVSEARTVSLTAEQTRRLDSLHLAVRDERHRWERQPNTKAHQRLRMKPMISLSKAYSAAMGILTPGQRDVVARRFDDPDFVPVVPSLAGTVPPALEGLEPHRIVEAVAAERAALGLSDTQVQVLLRLHVAVRDEPHTYRKAVHGPKGKPHLMMEPMISKRRAYNDAMSYLTEDQQAAADKLFRKDGYRPALKAAEQ
ncbi:MAG TPA: hypothetical protein VFT84_00885 [Gemmatimonadales bacterium]|nr:hypothetical protein [Gemmatimonadales bacterium]